MIRLLKYALLAMLLSVEAGAACGQQRPRQPQRPLQQLFPGNRPPTLEEAEQYRVKPVYFVEKVVFEGDTILSVTLPPVIKHARLDLSRHARMIRNLKKVYPIARFANLKLQELETALAAIDNPRQQERYAKQVEKELKERFTPMIRQMTFSQGRMLIKLIDRETGRTSYRLVQELRGNFTAFFWQGLARLFGNNLKSHYDPEGEDRLIEQLITLYEVGLI
jgi:hypothetical protein